MAAQQHVETLNAGEQEPLPNLSQWLKDNRLAKKMGGYFEEEEIIMEELLDYDDNVIKLRSNMYINFVFFFIVFYA